MKTSDYKSKQSHTFLISSNKKMLLHVEIKMSHKVNPISKCDKFNVNEYVSLTFSQFSLSVSQRMLSLKKTPVFILKNTS